jgi:hypothetical protein
MLTGAAMAAYGLAFVAAELRTGRALSVGDRTGLRIGLMLVALRPTKVSQRSVDPAHRSG